MMRRNRTLAFGLCVLLVPPCAAAESPRSERPLSLHGFGTAGLTHNGSAGAEFIRDVLQPRGVADGWSAELDSRIGLQLNLRATPKLEAVLQGVSYYNHAGDWSPELTWAFAAFTPSPSFKLRAGRLGWDVYMLSDSRNVGYSYLWVRPPPEYFGMLQISHIDGGDALFTHSLDDGLGSLKLYGGRADQEVPNPGGAGYDLAGTRVLGANLDFHRRGWTLRGGYTAVTLKKELPGFVPLLAGLRATGSPKAAALASDLGLQGKTIQFLSAGVVYERGPWQSQFLFNRSFSDTLVYPTKDSGYLLLGYRRRAATVFGTYSAVSAEAPPRATGLPIPNALDDAVVSSLAKSGSRQRTLSVGMRYDLLKKAALKLQLDRVSVHDGAALLWRNPQPGWSGRATVFSVALDFFF